MSIKKNIESLSNKFDALERDKSNIDQKLDELIHLLEASNINSEDAKRYKERFDQALKNSTITKEKIEMYHRLDDDNLSRVEMLNELGNLLNTLPVDNRGVQEYRKREWASKIMAVVIGCTLMALGFSMIVLPTPGSFEIYTLFYFTPDDGVTIMDIISLLIVFTGVFIIITALKKKTA